MAHKLRSRFWLELIFSLITGILAVATLFWHDWIEIIFRVDPDKGTGSGEWLVVVTLLLATVISAVAARAEWCRIELAET